MTGDPVVVWGAGMVVILAVAVAGVWVSAWWVERRDRRRRR